MTQSTNSSCVACPPDLASSARSPRISVAPPPPPRGIPRASFRLCPGSIFLPRPGCLFSPLAYTPYMRAKNHIAITVGLGLLVSSAWSQTIQYCDFNYAVRISAGACAEIVDDQPTVITEHFVKEGETRLINNQTFTCVASAEVEDFGPLSYADDKHSVLLQHNWLLPLYEGNPDHKVIVNKTTRVIGVPATATRLSLDIYQVRRGDTLVFVFDNVDLVKWYYNPKATTKYPKNSYVLVCRAH